MSAVRTQIEILNKSGDLVAIVKAPYPLNEQGMILTYSSELSDYGMCRFRISTEDVMFTQFGDVIEPLKYQVRIRRGQKVVWQGVIVDNTERNKRYVEIKAYEYLWLLSKVLIRRDEKANPGDGKNHLRIFDSNTMKTTVTNVFNQAIADLGSSVLSSATIGTVDTINFPAGYSLTGEWTWSSSFALEFDYHDALYVLKAFGIYGDADFELTNDLQFNFKNKIGTQLFKTSFEYGTYGNVVDYNLPRYGDRMANNLHGIAVITDDLGFPSEILHVNKTNPESIAAYGKLETAIAFRDVKNKDTLKKRIVEELRLTAKPDTAPLNLVLNENGIPFGQYGVGDIVKVKIKHHAINFDDWRRIVGVSVSLHNTGRELTVVQTNKPTDGVLEQ